MTIVLVILLINVVSVKVMIVRVQGVMIVMPSIIAAMMESFLHATTTSLSMMEVVFMLLKNSPTINLKCRHFI